MDMIIDNIFPHVFWKNVSEYFKHSLRDNNYYIYNDVCETLLTTRSNALSKNVITDMEPIDRHISKSYKNTYGLSLSRISRFSTVFKLNDDEKKIYISTNSDIIYVLLVIDTIDDEFDNYLCYIKEKNDESKVNQIKTNYFAILPNNDMLITGRNILVSILTFYRKEYPSLPLIRNLLDDSIVISRSNKIYDEIPDCNWFKFYIELNHNYSTSIMILVDGIMLYIKPSYTTHCIISMNSKNIERVMDDCKCCYSNTYSTEIIYKNDINDSDVTLKDIRGGIGINLSGMGKFSATYIGRYPNCNYLKTCMHIFNMILFRNNKIAGKGMNKSYVYGICHR
ncbi:hypothetical protein [Brazilian porcupinepox virus 1]|nr:hypothetical protein [Brazilian porcupinepox virus 1]